MIETIKNNAILFLFLMFSCSAMAQIPAGRSDITTMFPEFKQAYITLANGNTNRQKEANIFLKNSALVYKKDGKIMQAEMKLIKKVEIEGRTFVNCQNQLAEIVAEEEGKQLVQICLIDREAMHSEYLNESRITNIEMNDLVSLTRLDPAEDAMKYPLANTYYFIINSKPVLAHERSVRRVVKKDNMQMYESLTYPPFKWNDKESLISLLKVLK